MNQLKKTLILMGIKHCGKSTQGKLLAKNFNCQFIDIDDEILKSTGKTARQIYVQKGEQAFKDAEFQTCKNATSLASKEMIVISTGGGICNNSAAVEALKESNGIFIYLKTDENIAADRIIKEAVKTPEGFENLPAYIAKKSPHSIQEIRAIFHDFYVQRNEIYQTLADFSVNVTAEPKKVNLQKILDLLAVAGFAVTTTVATASTAATTARSATT